MKVFGPDDPWPSHQKPWWNDVLTEARARGWTLVRYSGHSWGGFSCPAEACTETIFSTADGSESFAKKTLRMVKRCPHRADEQTALVAQVIDRLDAATRFSDAAEELLGRDANQSEAEHLLELATECVGVDDDLERRFDIATQAAVQGEYTAGVMLADTPLEGMHEAAPVVEAADVEAREASATLEAVAPQNPSKEALVLRREQLVDRIERLKDQVQQRPSDRQ